MINDKKIAAPLSIQNFLPVCACNPLSLAPLSSLQTEYECMCHLIFAEYET